MVRDPHPAAFDALLAGLAGLGRPEQAGAALVACVLACLRELGFAPELVRCAGCGRETLPGRVALSARAGGIVCSRRCAGDGAGRPLGGREARLLRFLARTGAAGAERIEWTLPEARRTTEALGRYAEEVLGRRLRSLPVLYELTARMARKGAA
jgi:recombinational DNA repair protein (RecF pathway)